MEKIRRVNLHFDITNCHDSVHTRNTRMCRISKEIFLLKTKLYFHAAHLQGVHIPMLVTPFSRCHVPTGQNLQSLDTAAPTVLLYLP